MIGPLRANSSTDDRQPQSYRHAGVTQATHSTGDRRCFKYEEFLIEPRAKESVVGERLPFDTSISRIMGEDHAEIAGVRFISCGVGGEGIGDQTPAR